MQFPVYGNLVDILNRTIYPAKLVVNNKRIDSIEKLGEMPDYTLPYILPGFIDAHVHIESSMLVPSEFARLAVVHGTVATVSDPHEIANVCGLEGVEFMIENGKTVPFKFYFGAPSCVPATVFETAGAQITADDVHKLLERDDIKYLSEMMNFPGVLFDDKEVLRKIASAKVFNKPVDGHAPGLSGDPVKKYIDAGISTDHECFSIEEAKIKLSHGMNIIIREGSAAKNFDTLISLLNDYPEKIMFCSDDKHPDSLAEGHINQLCARSVKAGIDIFKVLRAACINPVKHYKLDVGLLGKGDAADFIIVNNLDEFGILETYIDGELVASKGKSFIKSHPVKPINFFNCSKKTPEDFRIRASGEIQKVKVIEALDGQLITNKIEHTLIPANDLLESDIENDILKIAVINRYRDAPVALAFIKNFGLKYGAIASSVAHDSHNIVVVGTDDNSMARAVNLVIEHRGGISCISNEQEYVLPLPVAGLMSDKDGYKVAASYTFIDKMAKELGSGLSSPFMSLSFMALLVIPKLKISDKGLFDGDDFKLLDDLKA